MMKNQFTIASTYQWIKSEIEKTISVNSRLT
jgi:hypothetical protein